MRENRGRVAQLVEHLTFNQVVAGSSPAALTTLTRYQTCVQILPQISVSVFCKPCGQLALPSASMFTAGERALPLSTAQ